MPAQRVLPTGWLIAVCVSIPIVGAWVTVSPFDDGTFQVNIKGSTYIGAANETAESRNLHVSGDAYVGREGTNSSALGVRGSLKVATAIDAAEGNFGYGHLNAAKLFSIEELSITSGEGKDIKVAPGSAPGEIRLNGDTRIGNHSLLIGGRISVNGSASEMTFGNLQINAGASSILSTVGNVIIRPAEMLSVERKDGLAGVTVTGRDALLRLESSSGSYTMQTTDTNGFRLVNNQTILQISHTDYSDFIRVGGDETWLSTVIGVLQAPHMQMPAITIAQGELPKA